MFTKSELELLATALSEYYNEQYKQYEQQKAKGRRMCEWHLPVMQKTIDLHAKVLALKNNM